MNDKDVFISYKAEEFEDAIWVKSVLENNGISCWMAPMSISGGASYATEIPKAIRACKVFLLMLSEKSQNSKWVPRELDQAINAGKTVLPFMLENCELKDDFNFYLTNVQRYAAYENKASAMKKMIVEIKSILNLVNGEEENKITSDNISENTEKKINQNLSSDKINHSDKKKSKKTVIKKDNSKSKKPRKWVFILSATFLSIVALIAVIVIVNTFDDVTIAGEKYDGNSISVTIKDAELSYDDLDSLSKMKKLSSVSFEGCKFPDYDIGKYIPSSAASLKLSNCSLTNEHIKSIDFKNMKIGYLKLDDNPMLNDLKPLSVLTDSLCGLNISNTGVSDIDFLKGFSLLDNLDAENCKLENLNGLSDCDRLTKINVNNNSLKNLKGLEKCIELKKIKAGANSLESLQGIENATILETVVLSDNQLKDISVLSKSAESLKYVNLDNNEISDISFLNNCSSLKLLEINNNKLTDLKALENLAELNTLCVSNNELESVEGLGFCSKLNYIDLSDNKITDTSDLPEITPIDNKKTVVDLSNNKIDKLTLPNNEYRFVALYGNNISDCSRLFELRIFNTIVDYDSSIDFDAANDSEIKIIDVVNCPLDSQNFVEASAKKYTVNFLDKKDADNKINEYDYEKIYIPN